MINKKIEELKQKIRTLEFEHRELLSQLTKKKAEIDGIASGLEKYKDNISLLDQLESIVSQRMEEIEKINGRIGLLKKNYKKANEDLNNLFLTVKENSKTKAVEKPIAAPVKIAASPTVSRVIDEVFKAEKMKETAKAEIKPQIKVEVKEAKKIEEKEKNIMHEGITPIKINKSHIDVKTDDASQNNETKQAKQDSYFSSTQE